jgi:uncharacterized membrane protein
VKRLLLIALLLGACTKDSVFGPPTGSVCPDEGTQLSYENFGAPFMLQYCTHCHSRSKMGDDRHGAPTFHDFDTLSGIKAVHEHVDETAAAGPDAVNEGMPDYKTPPTLEERKQLGEWIACGMPDDADIAAGDNHGAR